MKNSSSNVSSLSRACTMSPPHPSRNCFACICSFVIFSMFPPFFFLGAFYYRQAPAGLLKFFFVKIASQAKTPSQKTQPSPEASHPIIIGRPNPKPAKTKTNQDKKQCRKKNFHFVLSFLFLFFEKAPCFFYGYSISPLFYNVNIFF